MLNCSLLGYSKYCLTRICRLRMGFKVAQKNQISLRSLNLGASQTPCLTSQSQQISKLLQQYVLKVFLQNFAILFNYSIMIQTQSTPLRQIFNDNDFAWALLQAEVQLETSDHVSPDDVSYLLQLYMKGVEKMNSFLDFRQAYFKQKVMTLMSRPTVMKTLNNKNSMSKKNITPLSNTQKEQNVSQNSGKNQKNQKNGSNKKIEQIQLKQKKREIEVRLAYGVEQNTPEMVHKMISEQANKQDTLTSKISKIVQNHQQKLMRRVKERRLKTQAAKSLSNALINNNKEGSSREIGFENKPLQPGDSVIESCIQLNSRKQKVSGTRLYKSLEPKKANKLGIQGESPLKRSISVNMAVHISHQQIKMWNFSGQA